jgi:hypothetical protein
MDENGKDVIVAGRSAVIAAVMGKSRVLIVSVVLFVKRTTVIVLVDVISCAVRTKPVAAFTSRKLAPRGTHVSGILETSK